MTFTWDFNTATLLAIGFQVVLLVIFLVKTANTAKTAMQKAKEAFDYAEEAHTKIAAVTGNLALHREQVARDYVDRDDLRDLKDMIEQLGRRIDTLVENWKR